MENFNVNVTSWQGDLYLKSINLLPNGQMTQPVAAGITSVLAATVLLSL
ncbi:MAG: hypothetical protein WCD89_06560 [Anaerocolumna sp.]